MNVSHYSLLPIVACVCVMTAQAHAEESLSIADTIAVAEKQLDALERELHRYLAEISSESQPHEKLAQFSSKVGLRIPDLDTLTAITAITREINRCREELNQNLRLGPEIRVKAEGQLKEQEKKVIQLTQRNAVVKVRLQNLDKACDQWIVEYNELKKSDQKVAQDHLKQSIAKFVASIPKPPAAASVDLQFTPAQNGQSYMGIKMENLDRATLVDLGLKHNAGILIAGLVPNAPAENGGLRKGDIIHSVAGSNASTAEELQKFVAARPPGSQVAVEALRMEMRTGRWRQVSFTIRLETRPSAGISVPDSSVPSLLGVNIGPGSTEILSVQNLTLAADLGLRVGDILEEINGHTIQSSSDIPAGLAAAANDGIARVGIFRNGVREVLSRVLFK